MLSKSEIKKLLISNSLKTLMGKANKQKKKIFKDRVLLRGIIEFSNHCSKNCLYCGIRVGNKNIKRYKIPEEEIYETVKKAHNLSIKTIVFQSGEWKKENILNLGKLIEKIKVNFNLAITLSLGDLKKSDYKYLKESGADRYLLKFETSDKNLFEKLRPNTTLKERIKNIITLKELGFETGSGNIIGLPGSTIDTLAEDLILIKKLDLDMIGVGPFIPQKNTPLKEKLSPSMELVLKFLSLTRILNPIAHIPATTSLDALSPDGRLMGLKSGANVIMIDLTPPKYSREYEIYNGKSKISFYTSLKEKLEKAEKMIESSGNKISSEIGTSLKKLM